MDEVKDITVVIDAFRAAATAAYILATSPKNYFLATKSFAGTRLQHSFSSLVWIGKPEKGVAHIYTAPNSPSRILDLDLLDRNVFHRTEAGAKGGLMSRGADLILVAAFVNATATARVIQSFNNPKVTILPMGHEGRTPSLEDFLCANLIHASIRGANWDLVPHLRELREGPGKYFFQEDQWQYPREDFYRCLEVGRFNFAIRADIFGDYARLSALPVNLEAPLSDVGDVAIQSPNFEFRAPSI